MCLAIAGVASMVGGSDVMQAHGLSALTLAIVLGIVCGNSPSIKSRTALAVGFGFARNNLLRAGIVLYGFRLTLHDVAAVGLHGILCDLLVLVSTFMVAICGGKMVRA